MPALNKHSGWYFHWTTAFSALVICLTFVLFIGVPLVGRVAWSDETGRQIDAKITAATAPLAKQMGGITLVQEKQGKILNILAAESTREKLCRYAVRRITERDPAERYRLLDQIEELKKLYREYSGESFDTADC